MVSNPGLSPKCQLFFDRFVNRANKRAPYPTDWELFFDFICVCHNQESEVKSTDLYRMLIQAGIPSRTSPAIVILLQTRLVPLK